jgi:transposase-like protein
MPKNAVLSGCLDEFELGFVEREATLRLLMKLSIQLHLAGLSLSILEIFGVQRARSTVHNWVHKADIQPESGRSPDHVAVDETVIQIDDERYWLYAAVDPETNNCCIHRSNRPETTLLLRRSSKNSARNMTSTTPCFSATVRRH